MTNGLGGIGLALSGFAAGLSGQGAQFAARQQQVRAIDNKRVQEQIKKNKALEVERQKTVFTDSAAALDLAKQGRFEDVVRLGQTRMEASKAFPDADFKDTEVLLDLSTLAAQGNKEAADRLIKSLESNVTLGQSIGVLEKPKERKTEHKIVDGQVVSIDPVTGQGTASPIQNLQQDAGKDADRALRERELTLKEGAERRQNLKLSSGLEKRLGEAQDLAIQAQRDANGFDNLADDFERLNLEGGLASTVSETFKSLLGSQDAVTEFRRRFNTVRLSEGMKNLPIGPASDKDVELAFKGVPKENASAEQVSSFLRGAAKIARFQAGFNQFKSDFISSKSTGKGLNQSWRKKFKSPKLKRKVTTAEIYATAQNRNMAPSEVAERLGVSLGDL